MSRGRRGLTQDVEVGQCALQDVWGNIPGRGKGQGKGPAAGGCWCVPGASRKPGWLGQRERGESEEGRSEMGEWARGASE